MSENIGSELLRIGNAASIDASWRGPEVLADRLHQFPEVVQQFPDLYTQAVTVDFREINERRADVSASPQDSPRGHPRVPRTPQQQADLLLSRPAGWEYLLAAGVFAQGFDALEMKSLDHEMQIPRRGPRARVEIVDGMKYLRAAFDDLGACIRHITRVFEPEAQEKAFGAPGEPGDPVRIQHFARHVLRCYEDMLDWAASVRNHAVPDRLVHVFEVTSMMVDEPLGETRDFMREFVDTMERLVVYLEDPSSGEPITITIALVLTISDDVKAEFDNEMATLRREYGSSPS